MGVSGERFGHQMKKKQEVDGKNLKYANFDLLLLWLSV
jgi:hypothetical protein